MARQKEFNEDKVIEKAMALFRLKGYEATSIQDLVDHLGIGRGSIYDTFGNKHQLYLLALDRYLNKDNAEFDPANLPLPAKDLIIQMMYEQVDEALDNVSSGGCLMVNSAMELGLQDKAVSDRIKNHMTKAETVFVQLLTLARAAGDLTSDRDVQALARSLVNTVVGMRVTAKVNPNRQQLEDMVSASLSVLD